MGREAEMWPFLEVIRERQDGGEAKSEFPTTLKECDK